MPGRRRLVDDAPRLLGTHDGEPGKWFREGWAALRELGPFTGILRLEAGRVCVAWVQFRAATRALAEAQRKRAVGRGRRPSAQQIERLSRRQGLADGSYAQALSHLRDLVAERQRARQAPTPAELLHAVQTGRTERARG